jgi:type IV pilus assembly protein PilB
MTDNTIIFLRQVSMMQDAGRQDSFHVLVHKALQSIRRQGQGGSRPNGSLQSMDHAPTVALVNQLINDAIEAGASDIHLEPLDIVVRIRLRIDGELYEMHEPLPLTVHAFLVSRIKIMAELDIMERRFPQDGRILYTYNERNVDIRVSTMPMMDGENVVLRLLNTAQRFRQLSEIAFSDKNERMFHKICHRPDGVVILSGPVNSGKSSTLYAVLNDLNTPTKNIVTLEDPVEYRIQGVNQIPVNLKNNLSFSVGLRSILRLDPNIIMVGEIRDGETAGLAVRAALTGHLLFTTLHAGDCVHAVLRLLDMGVAPYLLSAALQAILSQRLVRRICPYCKTSYRIDKDSVEALFLEDSYRQGSMLYKGTGCESCHYTGYRGRLALHELLPVTDEIRQAITERKSLRELEAAALAAGMITMRQDGIEKALEGSTTLEEVIRVIYGTL